MRRIHPTRKWIAAAKRAFDLHRGKPKDGAMNASPEQVFLLGLYRQGYSAKQAGKLMAFLAQCEDNGDKLSPFDWFNVGFLECAPYTTRGAR